MPSSRRGHAFVPNEAFNFDSMPMSLVEHHSIVFIPNGPKGDVVEKMPSFKPILKFLPNVISKSMCFQWRLKSPLNLNAIPKHIFVDRFTCMRRVERASSRDDCRQGLGMPCMNHDRLVPYWPNTSNLFNQAFGANVF